MFLLTKINFSNVDDAVINSYLRSFLEFAKYLCVTPEIAPNNNQEKIFRRKSNKLTSAVLKNIQPSKTRK